MSALILNRLLRMFSVSEQVINNLVQRMVNRNRPLSKTQEDDLYRQIEMIDNIIGPYSGQYAYLLHPDWPQRIIDLWNKFCEVEDDDQPMAEIEEIKKRKADDDDDEEEERPKKMKSEESSSKPGCSSWSSSN